MIKLFYWNIKAWVEDIRYLLEYLDVKYEMNELTDYLKWFGELKPKLNMLYPDLPYIRDGDRILS